jgi:hypothetical protein
MATKWKVVALLSIVVPVGLVIGFMLGTEQQVPEKVSVEAVTWEIERPNEIWGFMDETIENEYTAGSCFILFNVSIHSYVDHAGDYGSSDIVSIGVEAKANASEGFVEKLYISFMENYTQSQVNILDEPGYDTRSENLDTRNIVDWADEEVEIGGLEEMAKGAVDAVGINKPTYVYYRIWTYWILRSPQHQSHQMEVVLQITYNNGTALKEAVLPVVLKLAADAGDTFETAKQIGFGNYTGWTSINTDSDDFYKVWIDQGQTVKIQLSPKKKKGYLFELHLYNSSGELVASSHSGIPDHTEQIMNTANQSGWWYVQMRNTYAPYGLYTLSIEEIQLQ